MTKLPRRSTHPAAGDAPAERETGTIARTVLVLRAVAQAQKEPTMKELADSVNLPMSTMHRLLDLLMQEGMVERDEVTRTFRPGFEFFRLGSLVTHRIPLRAVARPFLDGAARESGESSYLGMLDARSLKLIFITGVESGQMLDYRVPLNVPYALSTGASGLAALAWLSADHIQQVLTNENPQEQRNRSAIERALVEIREQGYAHTRGQRISGAVGTFSPVFDGRERVMGTLGFTVPEARFLKNDRLRLAGLAMHYAGELSRTLGYLGAWPRPATSYKDLHRNDTP